MREESRKEYPHIFGRCAITRTSDYRAFGIVGCCYSSFVHSISRISFSAVVVAIQPIQSFVVSVALCVGWLWRRHSRSNRNFFISNTDSIREICHSRNVYSAIPSSSTFYGKQPASQPLPSSSNMYYKCTSSWALTISRIGYRMACHGQMRAERRRVGTRIDMPYNNNNKNNICLWINNSANIRMQFRNGRNGNGSNRGPGNSGGYQVEMCYFMVHIEW